MPPTDTPTPTEEHSWDDASSQHEEHPRGTLFIMLLFMILIIGLWGYIYVIMLSRGAT